MMMIDDWELPGAAVTGGTGDVEKVLQNRTNPFGRSMKDEEVVTYAQVGVFACICAAVAWKMSPRMVNKFSLGRLQKSVQNAVTENAKIVLLIR
ncbi:hypothetical protein A3770_07p46930 [Chloropicon primus]|uniref:Uncharacterized protein n=1 Tax=Chloropicon primus TaxID=1764295 RepID=A0A5B8MRB4_9CHLO|nr:hypothetical protein A3770_07p46930 [Chloropicon primus]|eukprot:QDZ22175.1 hypothetical protein A3770_07p46930 [Chloropicon primus]